MTTQVQPDSLLTETTPSLTTINHRQYVNLSNGILAIQEYHLENPVFIRIQSTHCEQNLFGKVLDELSDDLLMHLAMGNTVCHVYDYGSRNDTGVPRAIWQGLEWVKYALYQAWWEVSYTPTDKRYGGLLLSMQDYFATVYKELPKSTKKKLKYYRKWLPDSSVPYLSIVTNTKYTPLDGNYETLKQHLTLKGCTVTLFF